MGIARAMIKLLMREGKRESFTGNIITIGRQDIYATLRELNEWAKELDFPLNLELQEQLCRLGNYNKNSRINDEILFRSLRFDKVDSLDSNDFERCSIVHDLNTDLPVGLHNCFDLVFDGGTSEHVFNIPKVLENYHKMLKVGGRIIHASPTSNYVDHGFYMFSPTLFYDYYLANRWEIIEALFICHSYRHDKRLWDIYRYTPGCLNSHSYGGLNKGLYATFFIARKRADSTFNAPVQQGYYLKVWDNKTNESWAKRIFRSLPGSLRGFIHYILTSIVPLRYYLKRVARY